MPREFKAGKKHKVYSSEWLTVYEMEIARDGEAALYSVAERPNDSVVIICVAGDGRLLLEKQFRFPTGEEAWEVPMGSMDKGETPEQGAARELREETGVESALTKLGQFHPLPGLMPGWAHVFRAELADAEAARAEAFDEDSDEILERKLFAPADVNEMVRQGQITDGMTLAALALLNVCGQGL